MEDTPIGLLLKSVMYPVEKEKRCGQGIVQILLHNMEERIAHLLGKVLNTKVAKCKNAIAQKVTYMTVYLFSTAI